MKDVVVRKQLTKTIRSKRSRANSLGVQEKQLRATLNELMGRRQAIEAEVEELENHLESLGGPIVEGEGNGA